MTWNGRVGIRDDLSRLHGQDRAAATSREIGYSSVTQGEGSLDLLTEDGAVRASLGDQADGRFGVSIWHKGTLRFIPDLIEDLEAEDVALSGRISGLGDRMITAEGRLDAHNTRIHDNDGRISGLGDRMVSAEGTLSSHGSRLNGHDSTLSSHNSRISTAQSTANSAGSAASTAQSRADSAWTRAGTGIADAAAAHARANSAYSRAGTAESDAAAAQQEADLLRDQVVDWMNRARADNPDLPPPIPS